MPLIERSGLSWIRDDLDWGQTETEKGVYKIPERTLAWVRAAHAHHLRLLAILNGSNRIYANRWDPQAFANWAAWMVKELHGQIDAVEILNEPNNFGFSKHYGGQHDGEGDSPWVAKYVTLMNRAAEAIRAVDPAMPVIGFGAGAPVTYKQLELPISPAVTAVADHPYSNHSEPELVPGTAAEQTKHFGFATLDQRGTFASLIDGFRQKSAQHHGPQEIWLTEWGYSTYQPLAPGQFGGFTEQAQAKYILRRFAECVGLGVNVSVLYEFSDGRDEHDAESRWGLVRFDGEPKPSYEAVASLSAAIRGLRVAGEKEGGAVEVFPAATWPQQAPLAVYRFVDAEGRPAVAIWATDRADGDLQPRGADVEQAWEGASTSITAIDTLTGNTATIPFEQSGGRLVKHSMLIRDYPVILKATGAAAVATAATGAADTGQWRKELKLLDPPDVWHFNNGQEFPGATGTFALGRDGEKPVGELNYDFRKGGAYVSAVTNVTLPSDTAELRVALKASQSLHIDLLIDDATGQCHKYVRPYSGSGDWETVRVRFAEKASEHWGGKNDGQIHFPFRRLSIAVGKPAGEPQGKLEFADLTTIAK